MFGILSVISTKLQWHFNIQLAIISCHKISKMINIRKDSSHDCNFIKKIFSLQRRSVSHRQAFSLVVFLFVFLNFNINFNNKLIQNISKMSPNFMWYDLRFLAAFQLWQLSGLSACLFILFRSFNLVIVLCMHVKWQSFDAIYT